MSNTLAKTAQKADGRYLHDQELKAFESLVDSFTTRLAIYQYLKNESQTLVVNALRRVIQTKHRQTIKEHSAKCQRDMLYTLQCIAKACLIGNTELFVEEYVVWMQNITRALHKEDSAIDAYRALQEEVKTTLPSEPSRIVNHYLDKLIDAIANGI
jgi:hypothetical protein